MTAESSRLSQAGYDLTGQPGGQLFTPVVTVLPVSAGNIKVGISTASEVAAAIATTAAGTLVTNLNAANNTVDTTAGLTANTTLFYPPAAALAGNLQIAVDGIVQTFNYNTAVGGNATSINGFINSFNLGHFGVSASFDATAQKIVFSRDPSNIDLVHRAAQGANNATPAFTITDSLPSTVGGQGTPGTSLLMTLGAGAISGVQQNATNAFGSTGGGGANALLSLFSQSLGAPSLQTNATGGPTLAGVVTVTPPLTVPPTFGSINVGDVLTIDAGAAAQENVTVTGVNRATGTITFTAANAHAAGFSLTTAQTQTLQQYYANFVAGLGLDTQTAITGSATQSTLSSNVDKVRQGVDGINIDEETQNLIKYQNAYAAAAHTISVLDSLLQTTIGLIQ